MDSRFHGNDKLGTGVKSRGVNDKEELLGEVVDRGAGVWYSVSVENELFVERDTQWLVLRHICWTLRAGVV
jgi:hypothetical protein